MENNQCIGARETKFCHVWRKSITSWEYVENQYKRHYSIIFLKANISLVFSFAILCPLDSIKSVQEENLEESSTEKF